MQTFQTINSDLVEASDTLVLNFPPDLYLPTLTQDAVVNFARSGLDKINTNGLRNTFYIFLHNYSAFISMQFYSSAFGQLVSAPAVLNAAIQNLTDLQTQFILDDVGILHLHTIIYVHKLACNALVTVYYWQQFLYGTILC